MEPTCFYFPPWGFTVRFMVSNVMVRHSRSLTLVANPARHLLGIQDGVPPRPRSFSRCNDSVVALPPSRALACPLRCPWPRCCTVGSISRASRVDWGSLAPLAVLLSLSAQVSNIVVVGRGTAAAVAHCDGRICDALLQASARTLSARGSPPQGFSPL